MSATWVHEKSLSSDVISEYDKGLSTVVNIHEISQGGQKSITASVDVDANELPRKKSRTERWITPSSSG